MDNQTFGFEDIFDMTDSEESSSSSSPIFEKNQPFVLELHELSKDDQVPRNQTVEKVKKLKKKKGQPANTVTKSHSSVSSDSISEGSSLAPAVDDGGKEEFYDAHDSYHTIQPNQPNPVVAAGQLQVQSEHNQNPKLETRPRRATSRDPLSTVSRPDTRPD